MKTKLYGMWLKLVEEFWDDLCRQHGGFSFKVHYKHRSKYRTHCDIAELALNYYKRNRNLLWEYFYNTCAEYSSTGKKKLMQNVVRHGKMWVKFDREEPHQHDMNPVAWQATWCPTQLTKHLEAKIESGELEFIDTPAHRVVGAYDYRVRKEQNKMKREN